MGTVAVEGMHFHAGHGYYAKEQHDGNDFVVDVYLQTNFEKAAEADELEGTVSYEDVYHLVAGIMQGGHKKLLEHLVHLIIVGIKNHFPKVIHARVRVTKLKPPIDGEVDRAYVESEKFFLQT